MDEEVNYRQVVDYGRAPNFIRSEKDIARYKMLLLYYFNLVDDYGCCGKSYLHVDFKLVPGRKNRWERNVVRLIQS